jgi:hypothetical protein
MELEEQQSDIIENPPFMDFDEHYIDSQMFDEEFWDELNNRRLEEKTEKENLEQLDNFILDWEREDDKYHDGKRD